MAKQWQVANQEAGENKIFDTIAKYFDYPSTGEINFCQFGQLKPKITLN